MKKPVQASKTPAQLQVLAHELIAEPHLKANHAPALLATLTAPGEHSKEPVLAAVQALKVFFLDALERGDLVTKRREGGRQGRDADGSSFDEDAAAQPEQVYGLWLSRNYASFLERALALVAAPVAPEECRVAAAAALMELVRGQRAHAFDNELFRQVVEAAVNSSAMSGSVVGLLVAKHLTCADVRYFTLRALTTLASRHSRTTRAASAAEPQHVPPTENKKKVTAQNAPPHDLARNFFDVLSRVPPLMSATAARVVAEAAEGGDGGPDTAGEAGRLRSWCGALEAGLVTAAVGDEGAKQRRKRQRKEGAVFEEAGGKLEAVAWASPHLHRKAFSEAWLAFLRMPLPGDIYRKVLVRLPEAVLPHLANPLLLSDFLTFSLDQKGLVGVLALNGLFILVTQHGLEYPHFYRRLYNLLQPNIMHAPHRARLLQLADLFLASRMVPAYTAAAFAKRFARIALTAPPAAALVAIAFVHNLLRRHPACNVLLHRPPRRPALPGDAPREPALPADNVPREPALPADAAPPHADGAAVAETADEAAEGVPDGAPSGVAGATEASERDPGGKAAFSGADVYRMDEEDPAESRALESSLWELDSLRSHYCPQVAAYVAVLDKDLTDRRKAAEQDIEPLVGASYSSLLQEELKRRLKAVPTAFYEQPVSRLFDGSCADDLPGWSLQE